MIGSDVLFWKPHDFPVGTGSTMSWCLCIYSCCLAEVCVWPLWIFECGRKSPLPNLWKCKNFHNGEEQMRSWGPCGCTDTHTVAGPGLSMGWGSGGNWYWGWAGDERLPQGDSATPATSKATHVLTAYAPDCSQTVCRCSNIDKKDFSGGGVGNYTISILV